MFQGFRGLRTLRGVLLAFGSCYAPNNLDGLTTIGAGFLFLPHLDSCATGTMKKELSPDKVLVTEFRCHFILPTSAEPHNIRAA